MFESEALAVLREFVRLVDDDSAPKRPEEWQRDADAALNRARALASNGRPTQKFDTPGPLKVYVAGPYTADPDQCTADAIAVGGAVLDAGHAPLVPHLHHYWQTCHGRRHYEDWMRIDLAWIVAADVVIRMPGQSAGADRETELARAHGIPVIELPSTRVDASELTRLFAMPLTEICARCGHQSRGCPRCGRNDAYLGASIKGKSYCHLTDRPITVRSCYTETSYDMCFRQS